MSVLDVPPIQSQSSKDIAAVPEPWHRTVYEDRSEDKTNALLRITGKLADLALGLQIQAMNATIQVVAGGASLGANAARLVVQAIPEGIPTVSLAADLAERVGTRARKLAQDAEDIAKTKTSSAASETGM